MSAGSYPPYQPRLFIKSNRLIPCKPLSDALILFMFYTFSVLATPFFRGLNIFYQMFVVPPPERYHHIILACVRNLAGDHSGMAIGTDL